MIGIYYIDSYGKERNHFFDDNGCGLFSLENGAMHQWQGTCQFIIKDPLDFNCVCKKLKIPKTTVIQFNGFKYRSSSEARSNALKLKAKSLKRKNNHAMDTRSL